MTMTQLTPASLVTHNQVLVPLEGQDTSAGAGKRQGRCARLGHAIADRARRSSRALRQRYRNTANAITSAYYKFETRVQVLMSAPESGAATAEYAVVLIAATAFAGILLAVLKSGTARELLLGLVKRALSVA
ncbi:hypothetical protein KIMH_14600 [Bombiscardovia apis]|uniref:DUF4244 domain-containing protein n=1 Tax=Bombiscardovia apis TaxID=2932182 RepID=A0ABM8BEK9_9BIFI|nr:DUF4244 domain-containing protein [Bombiscardovia apis]BDR55349.1 hypothetical protein KIMH_14600 [Bombiscardovia apis]